MGKRNLTDRTLKSLKRASDGKHDDVMDSTLPGFGVRVSDTGRRTFMLLTRYPGSKHPTRRALGEYGVMTLAEARQKAADWKKLIKRGIDPAAEEERQRLAEQRKQENSFAAVAEQFIAHIYRQKLRTAPVMERELRDNSLRNGDRGRSLKSLPMMLSGSSARPSIVARPIKRFITSL